MALTRRSVLALSTALLLGFALMLPGGSPAQPGGVAHREAGAGVGLDAEGWDRPGA